MIPSQILTGCPPTAKVIIYQIHRSFLERQGGLLGTDLFGPVVQAKGANPDDDADATLLPLRECGLDPEDFGHLIDHLYAGLTVECVVSYH